ncbi:FtsH protease activity modulator HflK [Myxococcota bacterium]|nr:FtsH protease activity modulator HflK [Myxococcota bacterium]
MARGQGGPSGTSLERSAGRVLRSLLLGVLFLAAVGAVGYLGYYQLRPGQAALVFRFGKYIKTESGQGAHWHLPRPIEKHQVVNVAQIERQEFGRVGDESGGKLADLEATMQTGDNNIVHLSFVVRYRIKDAFESQYSLDDQTDTLRDAAQAALREVVGKRTIDEVISQGRGEVELVAQERLQETLDKYRSGLSIEGVELQEVQPPDEVRAAFDDVIAASQDGNRAINEAEGYRNEIIPRSRAEAAELVAAAKAYRESVIAASKGETSRFLAVVSEYQRAPEVTRTRLYLETMEKVLPGVEKVIVEGGASNVLPFLPLGQAGGSQ